MRILILIGTRPEAIKLAPVILRLKESKTLTPVICSTGQHKEMLDSALAEFNIQPDIELKIMTPGQTLNGLTGKLFSSLEKVLHSVTPACILVQGDTATVLAGAMSGFYSRIPVGHVEAGLRSGNMNSPYPEEFNRRVAALATTWHFAPTQGAASCLLEEGINPEQIFVTGNTVVDALHYMRSTLRSTPPRLPSEVETLLQEKTPYVLITGHRRENFGQGMEEICNAITRLATKHPECAFVYPVHLNPQVSSIVNTRLGKLPNVHLLEPCSYSQFLRLLDNCLFIMSDSGGVQEEAPSLGKRVLVMRGTTERPEGVAAGVCRLVGTNPDTICDAAETLFSLHLCSDSFINPYGDGNAAQRIVQLLEDRLA